MATDADGQQPSIVRGLLAAGDAFGRFIAGIVNASVNYGPEVLAAVASFQVETEHFELLEKEWGNHPLLDFMRWQEATAGRVMALTLPQASLAGHAALARLLEPACTDDAVLGELEQLARDPAVGGWAADEFCHGLQHVRAGELDRAVAPLTLGLEGIIRASALSRGLLAEADVRSLVSGSDLVKRVWGSAEPYRPYMSSWVFGLANVYRHGADRGDADEQALHAICGAAISGSHILDHPAAFDLIQTRLTVEITEQYASGVLQLQPEAEARLERAAGAADRSDAMRSLLNLREQLLETRRRRSTAA